jgi:hypothetical protein
MIRYAAGALRVAATAIDVAPVAPYLQSCSRYGEQSLIVAQGHPSHATLKKLLAGFFSFLGFLVGAFFIKGFRRLFLFLLFLIHSLTHSVCSWWLNIDGLAHEDSAWQGSVKKIIAVVLADGREV